MKPLDYFFDTTSYGKGRFPQRFLFLFHVIVRVIFKPVFRYKAYDKHKLQELQQLHGDTGFIIAGNHRSYLDPVFVMSILYPRPIRYIAKEEFFNSNKIIARLAAWVGAFPVKRNAADMSAIKRSVRMLKRNELLGIFPEGTRIRFADQQVAYHQGIALIASLAKAPVVPVRLWNTEKIKPTGKRLFRCPKIVLRFGDSLSIEEERFASLPKEERFEAFTNAVMERVYLLEFPE